MSIAMKIKAQIIAMEYPETPTLANNQHVVINAPNATQAPKTARQRLPCFS